MLRLLPVFLVLTSPKPQQKKNLASFNLFCIVPCLCVKTSEVLLSLKRAHHFSINIFLFKLSIGGEKKSVEVPLHFQHICLCRTDGWFCKKPKDFR